MHKGYIVRNNETYFNVDSAPMNFLNIVAGLGWTAGCMCSYSS